MSESVLDTQPASPVKRRFNLRALLTGVLGFLIVLGLAAFGGYNVGIGDRKAAEGGIIMQQLAEQYQFAIVDMQFGRYEAARQRLEFIIAHDPGFAGAGARLTEVLVLGVIPTATPAPTVTPTPDSSGAESAYQRAVQLIQAQDWPNALSALDQVRKLDPNFKTAQVDGMYYFALRNLGVALITHGNLEGGIYHITLAERFGTLDNTAYQLRDNARFYVNAASFWELDWKLAAEYFGQLAGSGLWDGTMTAGERYHQASMRYGDVLFREESYCDAYQQYQNALTGGALDDLAARNSSQAYQACYPATAAPPPTTIATSETATVGSPTEPPTPPTEAPTVPPVP
jgi:hypothetical protein